MLLGNTVYTALHDQKYINFNSSQLSHTKTTDQKILRPNSAYNTFIKYNTKTPKENNLAYTHIFTDPEAIIKQHMKERTKNVEKSEEELLNLTKVTLQRSTSFTQVPKVFKDTFKNDKNIFPMVDSSKSDTKDDFKTKIIKFILAKRIYKDEDMEMLLKQLIHKNKNYMTEEEIKEVFNYVKEELEK
jgi:hypothetical protein